MKKSLSGLVILILLIATISFFALAGNLTPDAGSPTATMYTLTDIYNLIHNSGTATEGEHPLSASTTPDTLSSYSVSQLYADLANLVKRENVETGIEYLNIIGDFDNEDPDYATTTVISSTLDPIGSAGDVTGYTLDDIWNLIDSGATTTPENHDYAPTEAPTGTQHTLTEIYNALLDLGEAKAASVRSGVTYLGTEGTYTLETPNPFLSIWKTHSISDGSSEDDQIRLPLESDGEYDFIVDWGDETTSHITSWDQPEVTHTYETFGEYNLSIEGTIIGFNFANGGDKLKIYEISQWGDLNVGNNGDYFSNCGNLDLTATDNLDLAGTTNLSGMFYEDETIGFLGIRFAGDISGWDVSAVTDMSRMFHESDFNQDLSGWNVSSVTEHTDFDTGATAWVLPKPSFPL
ncbi:MAG: BspA family leucine-rich repeat surface protein [Candidatus Paceibacterota bacterium]